MTGDASSGIEHVIVLMLENRSFDHLLGFVDIPGSLAAPGFDEDGNPLGCPVRAEPGAPVVASAAGRFYASAVDPDHSHAAAMVQLGAKKHAPHQPDNRGFVESYLAKADGTSPEARDRFAPRLRWLGYASLLAVVLQWIWPLVAGVWLVLALLVLGVALALVWGGTSFSGYLPSTLLELLAASLKKKLVAVAIAIAAIAGLIVANAVGGTARQATNGSVILAIGIALIALASKVGAHAKTARLGDVLERTIVNSMAPDAIEPLARLARGFATCTQWYSPVPGETWPNRNFVHAGTSDGAVDIELRLFGNPTIFESLQDAGQEWAVYYRGVPQVLAFSNLWEHFAPGGCARQIDDLWTELEKPEPSLPAYTFIEPFHGTQVPGTNFVGGSTGTDSQHSGNNKIPIGMYDVPVCQDVAGHDFIDGMRLVADVYERLRDRPELFEKTLFVITYDEHGGYYDHRPPPDAVAPEKPKLFQRFVGALLVGFGMRAGSYDFTMLGPRVPTILVNSRIEANAVDTVFDHTSIPRTVRKLFGIDRPLSAREDAANTFDGVVTRTEPRQDLPDLGPWRTPAAEPVPETAPPIVVADDTFTRSLEIAARGFFHFVDLTLKEQKPEGRARRTAMRRARREVRRDVGQATAGPGVTRG